jgi:hypothetical protein
VIVDRVTSHYAVSTARCHREVGKEEVIAAVKKTWHFRESALLEGLQISGGGCSLQQTHLCRNSS